MSGAVRDGLVGQRPAERSGAGLGQGDAGGPQALKAGDVGVGRDLAGVGAPLHDPVGLVDEDDPGQVGAGLGVVYAVRR